MHGFIGSLVQLMFKRSFAKDLLFANSKVVFNARGEEFPKPFDPDFGKKLLCDDITEDHVAQLDEATYTNLYKLAFKYADGIIIGKKDLKDELVEAVQSSGKPYLEYQTEEEYLDAYNGFFDKMPEE